MYDKICSVCGKRFSEFVKTGLLGCPDCYREFGDLLIPYLKKIQGKTVHNGNAPKITAEDKALLKEYHLLLSKKESAGLKGSFKEMAILSDEIACLADELKSRGLL